MLKTNIIAMGGWIGVGSKLLCTWRSDFHAEPAHCSTFLGTLQFPFSIVIYDGIFLGT